MSYLKVILVPLGFAAIAYLLVAALIFFKQRSLLYFPSPGAVSTRLSPWVEQGELVGYAREVENPESVWLMAHGNAGEAASRDYILQCVAPNAAVYIVQYPGYGSRPGRPTADSLNRAVREGYEHLLVRYPGTRIGVIGESLGSGPASSLAAMPVAPRKIVLIAPFDRLVNVAADHMPLLPVSLLLRDRWDNVEALKDYAGPIEIYAGRRDRTIRIEHAERLAGAVGARLTVLNAGHNDWASTGMVRIK